MTAEQDKHPQLTNRFCSLPPELLSGVFDLTYEDAKLPTEPICKALLPFQRALLFGHLEVTSREQLGGLMCAVKGNAGLSTLAKKLDIKPEDIICPLSATSANSRTSSPPSLA
ncbi:hypothetical protein JCM5296_004232 [Sporobolomyces johnsonii]